MINEPSGQDQIIKKNHKTISWKVGAGITAAIALSVLSWPSVSLWMSDAGSIEQEALTLATVTKGTLKRDLSVSGRLVAANAPTLYSTESGQVELLVKPGEQVSEGQVVARIISPELSAEVKQAEATLEMIKMETSRGDLTDQERQLDLERSLEQALVALNAAERENKRAQTSYKNQLISEMDRVEREDDLQEAQLTFTHAEKRVELGKKRLDFERKDREFTVKRQQILVQELQRRLQALEVVSPINAVVGNHLVEEKEKVSASTPLMVVVDLSQYEVELNVPEFYADDLGLGLAVELNLGGKNIQASIASISPEVRQNQVQVRAALPELEGIKLRQNQRLNARILFESKAGTLMVKRGDFMGSFGGNKVFKLDADGDLARLTDISTGVQSVKFIEIVSGVQEGDVLIVSNHDELSDHQLVKIN